MLCKSLRFHSSSTIWLLVLSLVLHLHRYPIVSAFTPFQGVISSLTGRFKNPLTNRKLDMDIFVDSAERRTKIESWDSLSVRLSDSPIVQQLKKDLGERELGYGPPHTDAKFRLFDANSPDDIRITFYRDTAAWCPYCQKVWIFLEEKRIPYKVQKINMRSYGDKPQWFLDMVPNGLLPAIVIDDREVQTESLDIMLRLDRMFTGDNHPSMFPREHDQEYPRAMKLMRLERDLFSRWCNLLFRPSSNFDLSRRYFEEGLDLVERELAVTSSPWFLSRLSIVDLTFITHIERMCASIAYWSGFTLRGKEASSRWPRLADWLAAFEREVPAYRASQSDYYTHVMDIPPQYGRPYPVAGYERLARQIDGQGTENPHWRLPLPPIEEIIEPVAAGSYLGESAAREEAAFKLLTNHENVVKFALRGAGTPGKKRYQAPLADPYASPNLDYLSELDLAFRLLVQVLSTGEAERDPSDALERYRGCFQYSAEISMKDRERYRSHLRDSIFYLRDRIGVPRDMSFPAARELRAHLNWLADLL